MPRRLRQCVEVAYVLAYHAKLLRTRERAQPLHIALHSRPGQAVVDRHTRAPILQQAGCDVRSDESGTSSDENFAACAAIRTVHLPLSPSSRQAVSPKALSCCNIVSALSSASCEASHAANSLKPSWCVTCGS